MRYCRTEPINSSAYFPLWLGMPVLENDLFKDNIINAIDGVSKK